VTGVQTCALPISNAIVYITEYTEINDAGKTINHIQSIMINGWTIAIGENFNTWLNERPSPYKIRFIEKVSDTRYFFLTHKRNRSSIFATPCLRLNLETRLDFMFDYYLINTYLSNGKHLDLVYRFSPSDAYKNLEHKLIKHDLFVKHFDQGEYTILRFKIPSNCLSDIKLFLDGKYSKFSPEYKIKIMKFHGFRLNKNNRVLAVLNKYDWLKKRWEQELDVVLEDSELESKPNLDEEIWHI
jgi:hypothetical protein